jgi:hypothetical protein
MSSCMCARPCSRNKWQRVAGCMKQIDAGDMELWGVANDGAIWKRPVNAFWGSWTYVPGAMKHLSASGNGHIWGVNAYNRVYMCKKPCYTDIGITFQEQRSRLMVEMPTCMLLTLQIKSIEEKLMDRAPGITFLEATCKSQVLLRITYMLSSLRLPTTCTNVRSHVPEAGRTSTLTHVGHVRANSEV